MNETDSYFKTNFHTHSVYCDGKNTLEENVLSAIEKNIEILGFSSHSLFPSYCKGCGIKLDEFNNYCNEILSLKEKYSSKIDIRLGFEADFLPPFSFPSFNAYKDFNPEFLIGSVHFLYNGEDSLEKVMAVDDTPQMLLNGLKNIYGGNEKRLVGHYFSLEREMLSSCDFTIIAHADLIRKFNLVSPFFDENSSWYKNELKETASSIKKAGVIAEINTGAISRGWQKLPYPSEYFLTLLYEKNVPVMINSDSHDAKNIDFAFDEALQLAKKVGYKELVYPEKNSFIPVKI